MSNTENSPPLAAAEKSKLSKKLPTFRVGFHKQMDALRAYATISDNGTKPVHYSIVGDFIKVHEANVSSMNPFFVENGFLEKSGAGYMPTPAVLEYNRAHSWNPETAAQTLAPIIANTWFGLALKQRLQFRSISEDEGIEILASLCNALPSMKPQLRMLLDYCEASGILSRAGGQLAAIEQTDSKQATAPASTTAAAISTPTQSPMRFAGGPIPSGNLTPQNGAINLQIAVDVNLAEMRDWSPERITAFFGGIAQILAAKNKDG